MPANIFAYAFGIAASLIAGAGLCCSMGIIGGGSAAAMVFGIAIGLLGFAGMGTNIFIYKRLLEKGKQRYAYEIMELAKQISENAGKGA